MTRDERERIKSMRNEDKSVQSPSIYTHHDNAMNALIDIKKAVGGTRLAKNLRFDNSPPRDNKMYEISDLSNLNTPRLDPSRNNLSQYLELENIRPHQNTLARGFQKGSHYDYVLSGIGSSREGGSNFHSRRLSEHKVANLMRDTFT